MPREIGSYRFGESAIVPQDRPYLLAVEGSDKIYSLTHTVDSDGQIHMAVDIANETEYLAADRASRRSGLTMQDGTQRRNTTMPRTFDVFDEDDKRAYDSAGVIRDGAGIRVKMNCMDAAPNNNGLRGRGTQDDPYIIGTEAPRRRRRRTQRDPMGNETGEVLEESDAVYRSPGFRLGDAASRAMIDAAYASYVEGLTSAWKSPQNISDAQRATADACPAGVDPRTWAYEQGVREMCDAWKKPPPVIFDANGPEVAATTRAMENLSPGRFPMSAGIGSPCDLNGERGTLQPDGSGYLVCKVTHHLGPSRSGTSSGDAVTRGHQGITGDRAAVEAAWLQMVRDTANAWRRT
jgi:hypothetical protein